MSETTPETKITTKSDYLTGFLLTVTICLFINILVDGLHNADTASFLVDFFLAGVVGTLTFARLVPPKKKK